MKVGKKPQTLSLSLSKDYPCVCAEEVEGMCMEMGGSEFGVFVCGPASMQEEVGKLCRPRSWNGKKGHGRSLSLAFHSISFSL